MEIITFMLCLFVCFVYVCSCVLISKEVLLLLGKAVQKLSWFSFWALYGKQHFNNCTIICLCYAYSVIKKLMVGVWGNFSSIGALFLFLQSLQSCSFYSAMAFLSEAASLERDVAENSIRLQLDYCVVFLPVGQWVMQSFFKECSYKTALLLLKEVE